MFPGPPIATRTDTLFPCTTLFRSAIMRKTSGQLASRWGQILLRRALASAIDTPATINGADLAAERASLLLRMGESTTARRSEEHTSELQSLMRISYAVFCLKKKHIPLTPIYTEHIVT